jgi:hypothetical protein
MLAIADRSAYEDSENSELSVLLILKDSLDTRSSAEDQHYSSSFSSSL